LAYRYSLAVSITWISLHFIAARNFRHHHVLPNVTVGPLGPLRQWRSFKPGGPQLRTTDGLAATYRNSAKLGVVGSRIA
jgi:hypothetical protein